MNDDKNPAGWYPEPARFGGVDQLRYWDGAAWTEHVYTVPAGADSAAQLQQLQFMAPPAGYGAAAAVVAVEPAVAAVEPAVAAEPAVEPAVAVEPVVAAAEPVALAVEPAVAAAPVAYEAAAAENVMPPVAQQAIGTAAYMAAPMPGVPQVVPQVLGVPQVMSAQYPPAYQYQMPNLPQAGYSSVPGYAPQAAYVYAQPRTSSRDGLAIAALICGIVGVPFFMYLVPGVLGIIFGILGLKSQRKGMAIAGLICGAVSVVLFILIIILIIIAVLSAPSTYNYW